MNNNTLDYNLTKKIYLDFLKENNLYQAKKIFFYENNIEKMANWSNSNFKKTLNWYNKIRKSNKTKVRTIHLEKMKKWNYNKKKGVISHTSGEFFSNSNVSFYIKWLGKRALKTRLDAKRL